MAFGDNSDGRLLLAGYLPVRITLSGIVKTGDPVGYSSGWKQADGNNSIYAELVAGEHGSSGVEITCYRMARVGGITTGTAGNVLYLSNTAGEYSASVGTVSQRLGFELGNGEMLIEPKDIVLVRAEQVDWDDIEDVAAAKIIVGNASARPTAVAMSSDITINNAGATTIGAGKVTNAMISPAALDGTVAKVVADDNVIGGVPIIHRIDIAAGSLAETNVTLTHKTRVIDAWVILTGAGVASTTLKVQNGANAITDGMDVSGSDKALIRAATIDAARYEIAASGTLRVKTEVGATQPDCTVYVLGIRVA